MHIILEPNLFLERVDKLLSQWRNLKGKKLRIGATQNFIDRVSFKCDSNALEIPARVREPGEVLVEAENALNAIRMYSRIDDVEIFTEGDRLVIKQRNFTMSLPCITDANLENFADALSAERLVLLKLEKRRLREEIKRIDQEIASLPGGVWVRKRRLY